MHGACLHTSSHFRPVCINQLYHRQFGFQPLLRVRVEDPGIGGSSIDCHPHFLFLGTYIDRRKVGIIRPFTLDLKKVPVRRDHVYKIVESHKPSLADSAPLHQDGTDYSYFSPVYVGSQKQEMWMAIDTGASRPGVTVHCLPMTVCGTRRSYRHGRGEPALFLVPKTRNVDGNRYWSPQYLGLRLEMHGACLHTSSHF
jgi:hypothetical protein